jgi:hypothetical protein
MSKTIIGFAGRKRAGKTSLATYLTRCHEGTIVTVADALKNLVCDLLGFETIEELNYYKDNGTSWSFNKEKYAPIWAKTVCEQVFGEYTDEQYNEIVALFNEIYTYNVREILQFVGTDIIRKFKPNWHVDKMIEAIKKAPTDLVCVDDVRFPNERKAIEDLGGTVFFVMLPNLEVGISNHESEVSLTWPEFKQNRIILNMFTLKELVERFDEAYLTDFHLTGSNPIFGNANDNFRNQNVMLGYIGNKKPYDLVTTKDMPLDEYNFIKNILINNIKKHDGCILLQPAHEENMKYYFEKIYKKIPTRGIEPIVLWNPYIIENLKAWM